MCVFVKKHLRTVLNCLSKTKTQASHKEQSQFREPIKSRTNGIAQEKVHERVATAFGFISDWMRKWREKNQNNCELLPSLESKIKSNNETYNDLLHTGMFS